MAVFLKIEVVNLVFLMTFFVTSSSLTVCSRLILRQMLIRLRLRGRNLRHALIVGTNPRAIEFARKIESKAELGYRIVGFVDDHWAGIREFQKTGYAHVVNFEEFPVFLREHVVDEVVIGLLAEIQTRTYHESSNKPIYSIREVLDLQSATKGHDYVGRKSSR